MPNNEMDYSLIHRTPDGNGKILVTTPGSPDKGSWETEAELKTYVNQRVVKHTADLPGTTTPINAAQLNGVPDSGFVKKYSQSPADWDTVPTNGSNKPVTSDGVYDAINAISIVFEEIAHQNYNEEPKTFTTPVGYDSFLITIGEGNSIFSSTLCPYPNLPSRFATQMWWADQWLIKAEATPTGLGFTSTEKKTAIVRLFGIKITHT